MRAARVLATARSSRCHSSIFKHITSPKRSLPLLWPRLFQRQPELRNFSSISKLTESVNRDLDKPLHDANELRSDDALEDAASGHDEPWYLQVEPPRHVAAMEPPPLPEVPPASPPIIESLVKYTAEEMGLDHLSLLDLRQLDPPPALGPNLFMLFGTARSERHLSVSAGRLLRWLRAKHHIYADADGLLGSNERKTKLRRKARKAKLLGTMGTDDADDGIRTGWVCINLGTVGRGDQESTVVAADGRAAGFGVSQQGSTIVVQIMTESRRAEMDLETLWGRALGRSITKSVESSAVKELETPKNLHPLDKAVFDRSRSQSPTDVGLGPIHSSKGPRMNQAQFYSTERCILHETILSDTGKLKHLFGTSSKEAVERSR